MPQFVHKDTGERVQAVQLKKPLQSERGLPVEQIERVAWALDWFVVGPDNQGWIRNDDFTEFYMPVLQDPPLGAAVFDPSDGEALGFIHAVKFDPKGEMIIQFT